MAHKAGNGFIFDCAEQVEKDMFKEFEEIIRQELGRRAERRRDEISDMANTVDTNSIVDISNVQDEGGKTSNDVRTTARTNSGRDGSTSPGERDSPLSTTRLETDTEHGNCNQVELDIPSGSTPVSMIEVEVLTSNGHNNVTASDGNVVVSGETDISNFENEHILNQSDGMTVGAISNVVSNETTGPVDHDLAINRSQTSIVQNSAWIDRPNDRSSTSGVSIIEHTRPSSTEVDITRLNSNEDEDYNEDDGGDIFEQFDELIRKAEESQLNLDRRLSEILGTSAPVMMVAVNDRNDIDANSGVIQTDSVHSEIIFQIDAELLAACLTQCVEQDTSNVVDTDIETMVSGQSDQSDRMPESVITHQSVEDNLVATSLSAVDLQASLNTQSPSTSNSNHNYNQHPFGIQDYDGYYRIKTNDVCERCNVTFDDKSKLLVHSGCYKLGNLFECKICGTTCGELRSLTRHQECHLNKNYVCKKCSRRFNNRSTIYNHVRRCEQHVHL